MKAYRWNQKTKAEKEEYYRRRREKYRAEHPVTTDKQRKIIATRAMTPAEKAKQQAERDMQEELGKRRVEELLQEQWIKYRQREKREQEATTAYERRMLIAQYRERIEELTAERERLMEVEPLTSEIIGKANQLSQLKYNYARKIAELMNREDMKKQKGNKYILQEYGIRLD